MLTKNHLNIVLIDHEEEGYNLIRDLLAETREVQFNLDWVSTYKAGLKTIAAHQHDAYLVAQHLDKHNGLKLIREAVKHCCLAPFILLTEQENPELELAARKAGAMDCLAMEQLGRPLLERTIRYAIKRKQAEEALQKARDELEQRVTERTTALSQANERLTAEISERQRLEQQTQEFLTRRTRQVKTSTEIAQEIATTPHLEDLFRGVVNLVQKRFGYYHVHVYTLENDDLVMQEGTGEAGQKMKQTDHKIPLGAERSLVAYAARSGEPVLVPDVYQAASWLPNPHLPETKSEVAVPIKLRDEVLGVLDVQSDMVGTLGQEDQILLMGLCGQIAVAINTRRLEAKRREAEEAQQRLIEDLDAFAHSVGYNLREPLALIVGYAELLKEQARLTEELQGFLNAIARNGHRLASIIDELQLLTGVRKAEVEPKPLNMARIVAEVQQRLAFLIQEYQAKVIISEYWPVAFGHKPWVEQVLTNYLSNAIRYGGDPPRVQVGATAQSNGMVRFWVRDNGPGLTKEEQATLFTEFTDFKQVNIKGYGLGLSIVRRIITKLGGEVGVESEGIPGKGCIFSFTLPRYQA